MRTRHRSRIHHVQGNDVGDCPCVHVGDHVGWVTPIPLVRPTDARKDEFLLFDRPAQVHVEIDDLWEFRHLHPAPVAQLVVARAVRGRSFFWRSHRWTTVAHEFEEGEGIETAGIYRGPSWSIAAGLSATYLSDICPWRSTGWRLYRSCCRTTNDPPLPPSGEGLCVNGVGHQPSV